MFPSNVREISCDCWEGQVKFIILVCDCTKQIRCCLDSSFVFLGLKMVSSVIDAQVMKWALWHIDPFLGNDSVNTFPRQRIRRQQSDNFHCYATRCKYKTEEGVFSVWFAYIHCWAADVFSMGPPRDYVSSPVVNQKPVIEREREWRESSAAKEERFGWRFIMSYCNRLCLREIVKKCVNKPNHPIQNPLLLVTESLIHVLRASLKAHLGFSILTSTILHEVHHKTAHWQCNFRASWPQLGSQGTAIGHGNNSPIHLLRWRLFSLTTVYNETVRN
jgi:hypothetical protein